MSALHVRYDEELGWASVPNFYVQNYYAPGIYLKTNARGFRANLEFTERVPAGKLRIICAGDSFTFGEGVSNDSTWCQLLESLDGRFQTVNMGESGYGVDQMYLWYRRDGVVLEHDILVFAFITEDFRRMQLTNYVGHGKPVLKLRNGELAADNIPVPRPSRSDQSLGLRVAQVGDLRSMKLLRSLVTWALPARKDPFSNGPTDDQRLVFDKMIEVLDSINKHKNSILVLAFLPDTLHNYEQDGTSLAWRAFVREESAKRGIAFVDLINDFRKLPVTMEDGMFIWPGSVHYFVEAPGHYDDQGNEWVAREILARLIAIPEVAKKLARLSDGHVARRSR
jgi:hypothetical protein